MILGIDASRNRSGGAITHIIGILSYIDILPDDIEKIHLWSYTELLEKIPDNKRLTKHVSHQKEKGILYQIWWQAYHLKNLAKSAGVDILLNTDAGTFCRFHPSVTISRDMLSYEKGEINRFGFGLSRLRLWLLKYIQSNSLKRSSGAIFLTKYASEIIQKHCGSIKEYTIIPHGISESFRKNSYNRNLDWDERNVIRCIYVSNIAPYKHQWHVLCAIELLRKKGYKVTIDFVGDGAGKIQQYFDDLVRLKDPFGEFIIYKGFVKHTEIPILLQNSDLFIFASSCENMPNTLIEGMASGLPIACSDRGPMPEVLKNGGVYFNPENYISIAAAIEKILKNKELRFFLSRNAIALSNNYSWKRCSNETFEYLIKVHKAKK